MTPADTTVPLTHSAADGRAVSRLRAMTSAIRNTLDEPAVPWLVGLLAMTIAVFTWGGFNPVGVYHDEAAYLLQAGLFARGRVVGDVPPIPEFFEQFHVLLSPGVTPKYPPGFALSLVPGVWLGIPALMPILLTGLTGGLGFALARRVVGGPTALLAVILWAGAPGNLRFRAGYFSETVTSLLWILGWWALLRWRVTYRAVWLIALAGTVGFAAITRPLTALVFAVPLAIVVLRDVLRRRTWPALAGAFATGTAIVLLLPIQNHLVTGDWRASPYATYTTAYLPFDRLGFGLDSTPATRDLPHDMQALTGFFSRVHAEHTPARLPSTISSRIVAVLADLGGPTIAGTAALVILGLVAAPPAVLFAAATTALLLLAHLPYAHSPDWTLYYLEGLPVLALLIAIGIARIGRLLSREGRHHLAAGGPGDSLALAAAAAFTLMLPSRILGAREAHRGLSAPQAYFREVVSALPGPSIVFVCYGPRHVMHFSLIQNPPDYKLAHAWIAYDRGADNARLLSMAVGRSAYLYDEASLDITPMVPPVTQEPHTAH